MEGRLRLEYLPPRGQGVVRTLLRRARPVTSLREFVAREAKSGNENTLFITPAKQEAVQHENNFLSQQKATALHKIRV